MVRFTVVLFSALCLFFSVAAEAAAQGEFEAASRAYWSLEENLRAGREPAEWRKAAQEFVNASKKERADEALHMAAVSFERAYRLSGDRKDLDMALELHAKVFTGHRGSENADDSLLRTARIWENLGDLDKARDFYNRVLTEFKGGDMAGLAKVSLGRLGQEVSLSGVRHWSGPTYTRIVFELSGLTPFEVKSLPGPEGKEGRHRIFVDLKRAKIAKSCAESCEVMDGLVAKVRVSQFDKNTVRVVMDLDEKSEYRVFPLMEPARLVVDILREEAQKDLVADLIGKAEESKVVAESGEKARLKVAAPPAVRLSKSEPLAPAGRKLKIVLDPGHGGKDPGAIGVGKLREKDVVLAMVLKIRDLLLQSGQVEVKLTRSVDEEVPLARRTAIANLYQADLFVSVHANANRSRKARGIETFYLDRASDKSARKVAAAENRSSETGVIETEHILADVLLNMKLPESKRLAEAVQKSLLDKVVAGFGTVRDLGVRRAPFHVLTGAVMPAILIETAFISNPIEAEWLKDPKFQDTVAAAVAEALLQFAAGQQ